MRVGNDSSDRRMGLYAKILRKALVVMASFEKQKVDGYCQISFTFYSALSIFKSCNRWPPTNDMNRTLIWIDQNTNPSIYDFPSFTQSTVAFLAFKLNWGLVLLDHSGKM